MSAGSPIKKLQVLHRGCVSSVYLGACCSLVPTEATEAAGLKVIKVYHKSSSLQPRHLLNITREVAILQQLKDLRVPGVVHLCATAEDASAVYLVFEHCHGGDLYQRLAHVGLLSEAQLATEVLIPLLKVLVSLHDLGIIHRDIKPENIFLNAAGELHLGDFGLAINKLKDKPVSRVGTADYMAPEVLAQPSADLVASRGITPSQLPSYSTPADIWALGVLAYECLMGITPFGAADPETAALNAQFRRPAPLRPGVSAGCADFVCRVLAKQAGQRPSALQLLGHPWLQKFMGAQDLAAYSSIAAQWCYGINRRALIERLTSCPNVTAEHTITALPTSPELDLSPPTCQPYNNKMDSSRFTSMSHHLQQTLAPQQQHMQQQQQQPQLSAAAKWQRAVRLHRLQQQQRQLAQQQQTARRVAPSAFAAAAGCAATAAAGQQQPGLPYSIPVPTSTALLHRAQSAACIESLGAGQLLPSRPPSCSVRPAYARQRSIVLQRSESLLQRSNSYSPFECAPTTAATTAAVGGGAAVCSSVPAAPVGRAVSASSGHWLLSPQSVSNAAKRRVGGPSWQTGQTAGTEITRQESLSSPMGGKVLTPLHLAPHALNHSNSTGSLLVSPLARQADITEVHEELQHPAAEGHLAKAHSTGMLNHQPMMLGAAAPAAALPSSVMMCYSNSRLLVQCSPSPGNSPQHQKITRQHVTVHAEGDDIGSVSPCNGAEQHSYDCSVSLSGMLEDTTMGPVLAETTAPPAALAATVSLRAGPLKYCSSMDLNYSLKSDGSCSAYSDAKLLSPMNLETQTTKSLAAGSCKSLDMTDGRQPTDAQDISKQPDAHAKPGKVTSTTHKAVLHEALGTTADNGKESATSGGRSRSLWSKVRELCRTVNKVQSAAAGQRR